MELHKNFVKEEPLIKVSVQEVSKTVPKDWTPETAISPTTEWGTRLDRSGDRRCDDPNKHNGGCLVSPLLDKHRSNSEKKNDSQETNEISIRSSEAIVDLDKSLRNQSCVSSLGVNSLFQINTSETSSKSKESFVTGRSEENEGKVIEAPTRARLSEPSNSSTGQEWESIDGNELGSWQLCRNQRMASVIHVDAESSNKDAYNFDNNTGRRRRRTGNKIAMQQLSADDESQYDEDLLTLLNFNRNTSNNVSMQEMSANDGNLHALIDLLKNKYQFRDETNKKILYDYEISRFAEFYNITDFWPVFAYHDLIFWLQDPKGVIYMWSRTDESMILGGHDIKEALMNFLFYQENLRYIEEYTHELLSVKEVRKEADKWYEESKKTAIKIVATDELLKPLEEKKNKSKKGGKQKKKKNKH